MRPNKIHRQEVERACRRLGQGEKLADIAKELDVHRSTLHRKLSDMDCPNLERRVTAQDMTLYYYIYQDRTAGMSVDRICDKYNISRSKVYYALRKYREKVNDVHVEQSTTGSS